VGRNIAARCHDNIGVFALVVTGPVPDSDALRAMLNRIFQVEVLYMVLLVGNDDVDVVDAPETVICN